MFRFLQRFGRDSQARWRGTGPMSRVRRRNHRLNCEALECRQMLSGFYIVNAASGKVLDVPGGSLSNGAFIQQWQLVGGLNQRWNLVQLPNSSNFSVVNEKSGLVLDDPGSSTSNGARIIQYQSNGWIGTYNQQWNLVPLNNGNYEVVNAYSGLVLGDPGSSTRNGTQIIQWQWNAGLNEQWTLLAAGDAPVVTNYVVNAYSGKVLDDPGGSTSNGTFIDQWQLNGTANQHWTFVPLANGADLIVNASSGKVLDEPLGSTDNGVFIQQWQLNGGVNQQWQIVPLGNGNNAIRNAASWTLLDSNSSNNNGDPMIQWQSNGALSQQWALKDAGKVTLGSDGVLYAPNNFGGVDAIGSGLKSFVFDGAGTLYGLTNDGTGTVEQYIPSDSGVGSWRVIDGGDDSIFVNSDGDLEATYAYNVGLLVTVELTETWTGSSWIRPVSSFP